MLAPGAKVMDGWRNRWWRWLVVPTIVLLARLPVPWGHTHDTLSGRQLDNHLAKFHGNPVAASRPRRIVADISVSRWHWHFVLLALNEPDPSSDQDPSDDFDDDGIPIPLSSLRSIETDFACNTSGAVIATCWSQLAEFQADCPALSLAGRGRRSESPPPSVSPRASRTVLVI